MEASVFSSFLEPDHTGTDKYKNGNSVKTTMEVPVKRLDEVLPELREAYKFKRAFLKLDTQGFDFTAYTRA